MLFMHFEKYTLHLWVLLKKCVYSSMPKTAVENDKKKCLQCLWEEIDFTCGYTVKCDDNVQSAVAQSYKSELIVLYSDK